MTYEEKCALARTGDVSKEAAAARLIAARHAIGLSQKVLGEQAGITKAAVNNSERARSYPGREVLIYLYREHRIDLNFTMYGTFTQLPADVQERIFDALQAESSA
ncbi:helix-turn-helix domain-containing protein [Ferrimonas balearica]|nr:helix-turn-helix domain-containing protein [Ferrimonas balearica]